LFSKGYGNKDPKSNVVDKFANLFGGFMVPFAELKEGLVFDFPGSYLLVGPDQRAYLIRCQDSADGLEYYAKTYVNFA
jgi:hypothetical protein